MAMPGQPDGDPGAEGGGTPPAAPPPLPWPGPPSGLPGQDLMPGAAPPVRQSSGLPHPGSAPHSVTRQFRPEPYRPGDQHTLIVSGAAGAGPYEPPPRPRYGPPEPRLQRLLFSRRLGYLAAAVAVVLVVGLAAWWLTSGRYTDVPKVTGMTVAAATAELRGAGFTVTTGTARLDNRFAKGHVIRSVPAGGQRGGKGSHITLIPSAAAPAADAGDRADLLTRRHPSGGADARPGHEGNIHHRGLAWGQHHPAAGHGRSRARSGWWSAWAQPDSSGARGAAQGWASGCGGCRRGHHDSR
jgi:hypothetical protein